MTFTIAKLNRFPKEERNRIYLRLVPESIFERFQIDRRTLRNQFGERVVRGIFPPDDNFGCIEVKYRSEDRDCIFSCQVSLEAFMQSLHLDFLIINNPFSERFNIDVDDQGRDTLFGIRLRNIPEEIRSMEAGLAPGMVRPGLRLVKEFVGCLDGFMDLLGLKTITIGAFFYHNAVIWERYGFGYFRGRKVMERIHREFQPGGMLYEKIDDSTPFRRKGMERTIRGRSWAIHDGVYLEAFGEEWESPVMYRMLGKDFKVNTFPGQIY
ncbi:MAG: hypothetical protein HXY46_11560 [Syntrophaceae bacterium]|nr:hypothetical protein [Syntrophaceae bacterium]